MARKYRPSMKTVFKKLDRQEPFTDFEKQVYSVKEQNLIRSIQLRDKESKEQAIQTYHNYEIEGKRKTKALASDLRNYVKSKYPRIGGVTEHKVTDFKKARTKAQVKRANKQSVNKYLKNKDNYYKNEKKYNKVKTAHKKYPNADMYEIMNGVNSVKSQNHRMKNGLNRNYK